MSEDLAVQSMSLGMGTGITHRVFGRHAKDALRAVDGEAVRLEKKLSRFMHESEISRINRSAGKRAEKVSAETYELLSYAAGFSRSCQGKFDITIGPLVDLWDYRNSSDAPTEARIRQVLPLVNHADLILDPTEKTAGLQKAGQSIDLGGIGKGFASDKFIEIFRKFGVSSAFTNIGGNVAALGTKPDGFRWSVGIQHPRQENGLIGTVLVADKAVVTSGDYQRFFVDREGKRRHHILNPNTGYPAESGVISVTVVADSAAAADALSTLMFVAGIKQGLEFLRSFPGSDAIFVDADLQVYVTKGLTNSFHRVPTDWDRRAVILD